MKKTVDLNVELLQTLVEGTQSPFAAIDLDFRYITYNKPYESWFKDTYGLDLKINASVHDLLGYSSHEKCSEQQNWQKALSGESFEEELSCCSSDIESKHYAITYYPVKDSQNTVVGAYRIQKDITEQKQLKEALETQQKELEEREALLDHHLKRIHGLNKKLQFRERLYNTLTNTIPDFAVIVYDKDFRYVVAEGKALEQHGYKKEEIVGKTIFEVLPESAVEALLPAYKKALTGELLVFEHEANNCFFQTQIIPLENEKQEVERAMIVIVEVTRYKQLNRSLEENLNSLRNLSEELMHQNQQLEDFASITSHNLRSPISNLSMLVNLYKNETNIEEKELYIDMLEKVGKGLLNTINDLAETLRINREYKKTRQLLNVKEVFEKVKESLSAQILESGAMILDDFSEAEMVSYPVTYLESIFLNLLSNAIKYRSPDRPAVIQVKTKLKNDGTIELSCEDNGQGINLKRNGHKLFKLYKTFHRNPDARGIGLFITKNQIEALGGSISAKSKEGKGAKFIVSFDSNATPND